MACSPVVLVADDDPVSILQYEMVLKPFLGQVTYCSATNGVDAVEIAVLQRPRLVLLDYEMPLMDGLTACQKMRRLYAVQEMDIWIVSSHTDDLSISKVLSVGASCLIRKPIRVPSFREMICQQLQLDLPTDQKKAA
jgi:CheY-like chemotaxis protein